MHYKITVSVITERVWVLVYSLKNKLGFVEQIKIDTK